MSDPILNTPLVPVYDPDPNKHSAYQFFIRNRPAIEQAAHDWYVKANGYEPSDPDICHGGLWRPINEPARWGTLCNAFRDTWPYAGMPDADPFTPVPQPSPVPAGLHLEVRGNDFVDTAGQPTCYSGVDQFQAFRMWLDGRTAELEALVAESLEFNFQWWRVLFMGSKAQNTLFDLSPAEPNYYPQVRPFADWLNQHGIGLLATIGADNQDVQAPMPEHWVNMADLLRGSVTIYDGGNEAPKNGFDPQAIPNPNMIWSRGSGLADEVTSQNGATCASFHQRTDHPKTMDDAVASVSYMRQNGYTVLMMDEPTRFDQDGSNKSGVPDSPRFAFQLASIYRAMWSLAVFHNGAGQRGQLMSPELRAIASEWARGLK